ncbi:MAG: DUF808 domain-containing protein [Alphaproteobacteria bacterium]|nr:DUF808 domain-containing protein [Alphaproteobacteria bacterium]
MAGSGLLALLDDISTILDDIALMSKTAAQKTAGIVGDDLAVGAQGMVGIDPARELPIVKKVAIGSLKNKAWLIPLAIFLPAAAITPLLMFGGAYLCFEAVEKILHKKTKKDEQHDEKIAAAIQVSAEELEKVEKTKIKQAIKTDAILSAEIIAVALGTVAAAPLLTKALVLSAVGVGMTVGVYGLVAAIIKMDDLGLYMTKKEGNGIFARAQRSIGRGLIKSMAPMMKGLAVVGTAAMFLVGGGILLHGIPVAGAALHAMAAALSSSTLVQGVAGLVMTALAGMAAGAASLGIVHVLEKPFKKLKAAVSPFVKKLPFLKKKITDKTQATPVNTPPAQDVSSPALKETPDLTSQVNKVAAPKAAEKKEIPPPNQPKPPTI